MSKNVWVKIDPEDSTEETTIRKPKHTPAMLLRYRFQTTEIFFWRHFAENSPELQKLAKN